MKKVFSAMLISVGISVAFGDTPIPSPQPLNITSQGGSQPIGFFVARKLQNEFTKAQWLELEAFKRKEKPDLKTLKATHSASLKEWLEKEKLARREFFTTHSAGKDRRAYIQDWVSRRKDLLKSQENERNQLIQAFEQRVQMMKTEQATRLKEFKDFLRRGEQPPSHLWPAKAF